MKNEPSLKSLAGDMVALKSVHLEGRLQGLMLTMNVQQKYRNDTRNNLETIYTFPLGWGATLLGLNVEIAGKRLQATVIEKRDATEKYEKAIDDGDMPVMVEQTASGLYTANLGNLKAGESVTIDIEYAQLFRFEQGQVRICIPTVIAPRFGDAHQAGGLALHETDAVNPLAEYPLTLRLDILGQIAKSKTSCPSHKISTSPIENGVSVFLDHGGMLDRDFVLNLDGLAGQSFAVAAPDGKQTMVLASFCPKMETREAQPVLMKILVDCSGSMQGDSISQARAALQEIALALTPADCVSYSKFGTNVVNVVPRMEPCSPHFVQTVLSRALLFTEADLGGTEINEALLSTFSIKSSAKGNRDVSVLLITDGDVWNIEETVSTAARSGHRIFAIGLGSSPAESLLRDLAEQTGGACELVSPNEDISSAIVRMFRRMRAAQANDLQLDWGCMPSWQSPLPKQIYDGETVHVFAVFQDAPTSVPMLTWSIDSHIKHSSPELISLTPNPALSRLGGTRQLASSLTPEESLAIALRYQLVTKQSCLFLVHVRTEEGKAFGLPTIQQIEQMHAAGHSGFGVVGVSSMPGSRNVPSEYRNLGTPALWRGRGMTSTVAMVESFKAGSLDSYEIPAFLRKTGEPETKIGGPQALLRAFNNAAMSNAEFGDALAIATNLTNNKDLEKVVAQIVNERLTREQVWALLLDWLIEHLGDSYTPRRHSQRVLRSQLVAIDDEEKASATRKLAKFLHSASLNEWGPINESVQSKLVTRPKNNESVQNRLVTRLKNLVSGSKGTD